MGEAGEPGGGGLAERGHRERSARWYGPDGNEHAIQKPTSLTKLDLAATGPVERATQARQAPHLVVRLDGAALHPPYDRDVVLENARGVGQQ